MQINEFIQTVCEKIRYKPIRASIEEELKGHIEDLKDDYIKKGNNVKEAEEEAIKQMGEASIIGKQLDKIHRPHIDWKMLIIIFILLLFGLLVSFIKTNNLQASEIYFLKYIKIFLLGFILCVPIYFINFKHIKKISLVLYIIATISILMSLWFGIPINGIKYLRIFNINVLPQVIAMPLYIIAFVSLLEERKTKNNILTIILSILSLILMLEIPSKASMIVLLAVYIIVGTYYIIKVSKNKKRNLLILYGIIGFAIFLLLFSFLLRPYILDRIIVSFVPEMDPQGNGWLGVNRDLIINSAKLFGEATNKSQAIDIFNQGETFAFISLLANYGWIVTISMVVAVLLLSIKLIINVTKIKDTYGKMLTLGIASLFIVQSVLNILMNLNLGLEASFNIPLVSYGGPSLVINMMTLTLVLAIYRRKDILEAKETNSIFKYKIAIIKR